MLWGYLGEWELGEHPGAPAVVEVAVPLPLPIVGARHLVHASGSRHRSYAIGSEPWQSTVGSRRLRHVVGARGLDHVAGASGWGGVVVGVSHSGNEVAGRAHRVSVIGHAVMPETIDT
jgi:hypothetical protein